MRRNYYDQSDATRPGSYGAVPPQRQGGIVPRPENNLPRWEPNGFKNSHKSTPVLSRTGKMGRFGLLFALILLLTGTGVLLNGIPAFRSPADAVGDVWGYIDPGYGWDYYESEDWTDELESTIVKRAPTGDGTVLELKDAGEETLTPQEIYARVSPSVVGIRAGRKDGLSLGTGIIMSPDGYIITNAHVISGAGRVSVTLSEEDMGMTWAMLVGYDRATDLAVLKIDASDLPAADFGDSSVLRVGEAAYAIGNPLGEELRGTMTDGIISAIDRDMDVNGMRMTLLQTTAALNPGNSGGALINAAGQVVGITNMKMMSSWETIEGLGFAIPTSLAKEVVDQIIKTGTYVGTPTIGITVYNLPITADPTGLYVADVEENSDAYAQGLRPGDIITRANGHTVQSIADLEEVKAGLDVGDAIDLIIWNEGSERVVTVRLVGKNQL